MMTMLMRGMGTVGVARIRSDTAAADPPKSLHHHTAHPLLSPSVHRLRQGTSQASPPTRKRTSSSSPAAAPLPLPSPRCCPAPPPAGAHRVTPTHRHHHHGTDRNMAVSQWLVASGACCCRGTHGHEVVEVEGGGATAALVLALLPLQEEALERAPGRLEDGLALLLARLDLRLLRGHTASRSITLRSSSCSDHKPPRLPAHAYLDGLQPLLHLLRGAGQELYATNNPLSRLPRIVLLQRAGASGTHLP